MEDSTIGVKYAPGCLPAFWDRSVLFFGNLLALFYGNEGATQELTERVGGVETYGGRLCPLVDLLFAGEGQNLLVLESLPDERLLRYFADDLALDLPEVVVLQHEGYLQLEGHLARLLEMPGASPAETPEAAPGDTPTLQRIAEHTAGWIDGFVTDGILTRAAELLGKRTLSDPDSSRHGNNKLLLHQFLEAQGFPVFDTVIVESVGELAKAAETLRRRGYETIVAKAQVGASGIGMRKMEASRPVLGDVAPYLFYEGEVLVQGWLDDACEGVRMIGSPSLQLFLDETTVHVYDVTEQILSRDSVHEGNCSPPPFWHTSTEVEGQMHEQVVAVGRWLHGYGYRGTASADFLVVERRGRTEVFVCEINARVTGATYPSVLARRFCPAGHWLMRNLRIDVPISSGELLNCLRREGGLLCGDADEGVLPINFNLNERGLVTKGQFLCIGPDEHTCFEYLMRAADVLPVTWTYDRD